jgi:hypothetical protein
VPTPGQRRWHRVRSTRCRRHQARPEIAGYFGDFDLVPPGIVPVTEWPHEAPGPAQLRQVPAKAGMLAGIGRKIH